VVIPGGIGLAAEAVNFTVHAPFELSLQVPFESFPPPVVDHVMVPVGIFVPDCVTVALQLAEWPTTSEDGLHVTVKAPADAGVTVMVKD